MLSGARHPSRALTVRRLRDDDVEAVVALHRRRLAYSLNSRLGPGHLAELYRFVAGTADAMVCVAEVDGDLVGIVSAAVAPERVMSDFLRSRSAAGLVRLGLRVLAHPDALVEAWTTRALARPVRWQGQVVEPCLTAIAVDEKAARAGVGRALVAAVADFCREHGKPAFRLDTRVDNVTAREFYRRLGFVEVETRGRDVILVSQR